MEVQITAQAGQHELRPGLVVPAWVYNGQVPGPLIRIREGERVRIAFRNEIDIQTAVHWHGLQIPNGMDGAAGVTQVPVGQGQEFVYEFEPRPAGTYIYHAHGHGGQAHELDMGLVAPLIIDPAGEDLPSDRELLLVLDEWEAPETNHATGITGTLDRYNVGTINGKAAPATEPVTVQQGELVRLRIINTGFTLHGLVFEGHAPWVTHVDGRPLPYPQQVRYVQVAPYERLDALLLADNPGEWRVYDPVWQNRGMTMILRYEGKKDHPESTWAPQPLPAGWERFPRYNGLAAGSPISAPGSFDQVYKVVIQMDMTANKMAWTINGESWPDVTPMQVRAGERVRLRLGNMTMEDHPMHLHGHSFQVIGINGQFLGEPWFVKDTVNLRPMNTIDVAFVADNPGKWLLHCHQAHHADDGLSTLILYE
jgi:FtsP/CotA-like multicopper oxidase with cupredoxin domain